MLLMPQLLLLPLLLLLLLSENLSLKLSPLPTVRKFPLLRGNLL